MKWVDLISLSFEDGKLGATTDARWILEGDRIRAEGNAEIISTVARGLYHHPSGGMVTPKDGERFLEALGLEFRSVYSFATDVQEGETIVAYQLPPMKKVEPSKPLRPRSKQ